MNYDVLINTAIEKNEVLQLLRGEKEYEVIVSEFSPDIFPTTGNGFTKATNGQIIPEYKMSDFARIEDGAQLIEIGKDGKETLKAIYDVDFGRFVPIE